jgi:N-acetylglucosamine kinase-like BadF-type ATPase
MSAGPRREAAILAVDGGNSKTDVILVARTGELLAAVRGDTISHQQIGLEPGVDRLVELVRAARERGGVAEAPLPEIGAYALAGADTPGDIRRLTAALAARHVSDQTIVVNDTMAPLRAGSERGWGVALICGAGVNAAGVAPNGRTFRFAALGEISGDRGGGGDIGMAALGASVRARDGRGPRTILETLVPAHFGRKRPIDVTLAAEAGRISHAEIRTLSPVVFEAAHRGDAVAQGILDDLADELVIMANAVIRRLHLTRLDVDVTLAGGVFRARDQTLEDRIAAGIHAVAAHARVHRLGAPPVLGPALMGLDRLSGLTDEERAAAITRLKIDLTADSVTIL